MIRTSTSTSRHDPPVIELTSTEPGAGKTHLIYLLTALACLPRRYGGRNACVAIIDTEGSFDVNRLAQHVRHRLQTWTSGLNKAKTREVIESALYHVYIYRPESMAELVEVVGGLPTYFFHGDSRHYSMSRRLGLIAIDTASDFYWETRFEEENAHFTETMASSSTSSLLTSIPSESQDPVMTYVDLANALKISSKALHTPVIYTTRHSGPVPTLRQYGGGNHRVLRPSLPASMSQVTLFRLVVRRVPRRTTFTPDTSVEEMEQDDYWYKKSSSFQRFEAGINEFGLSKETVNALRSEEDGFFFHIKRSGVIMEQPIDRDADTEATHT